ncbi:MAG: hypothetical protein QOD06_308, partial [Candidatus Binatota bacterium]|nr:hypothetical protein [Candidatus Binatota bacterium]
MPIFEPDEERKSYSAVFLVVVGLLLAGSIWAVWDDNIIRRPWKRYQSEFNDIERAKVEKELATEEERLRKDPAWQEATAKLVKAKQALESGETEKKLDGFRRELARAQVHEHELDLKLRIVKSEIEEARYEYEHAQEVGGSGEAEKKHLQAKEAEKVELDRLYKTAQDQRAAIEKKIGDVESAVTSLEDKLRELELQKQVIVSRLEGLTTNIPLGVTTLRFPPIPKIQQIVLPGFDRNHFDQPVERVDRCVSCHAGAGKAGFDDQPEPFRSHVDRSVLLTAHPPEKFGCSSCHEGQGAAVNSPEQAHGEVQFWDRPLLRGDNVESNCLSCHTEIHRLPHTTKISAGESFFEQFGCHGCHLTEGYEDLPKVGPSLRRLAAKDDPGWVVSWIHDPQKFRPRTKMPWFLFSPQQSEQVAAFLLSTSKKEADEWRGRLEDPQGVDAANAERVARGKQLVDSVGCRGCHAFEPDGTAAVLSESKDVAPNLSRVADKTDARWIYNWIRNPRGYDPSTRMPNLRLSEEEAAAITSFLLTLKGSPAEGEAAGTAGAPTSAEPKNLAKRLSAPETIAAGEKLVRKYGCFGCHEIPGMEKESRVGVELSFFGSKGLEELYFGYHHEIPRNWVAWTNNKLHDPRIYQTEFIEQAMPNFRLKDSEIDALRTFLASRVEHKAPAAFRRPDADGRQKALLEGRRLVERYNCIGCHVIDGRGGQIRKRYEENPNFAP